jgi:hypothetical protein
MTLDLRCGPLQVGLALAFCLLSPGCSSSGSQRMMSESPQCRVTETTPVTWTEQTAFGSPEAVFASLVGTCQAPFSWDGSGFSGTVTAVPAQGQSTLTATVAVDSSSARWVTNAPAGCLTPALLQVDGTVTLELPEGKVAYQQPVTINASSGAPPTSLSFSLQEGSFGPWVSLLKKDSQSTLAMSVQLTSPGRGCSGQIILNWQKAQNGTGSGASGPFATWSDTGCDVGQSGVSLAEPWQGVDLAATVAASFGQRTLFGTWDDGSTTTLSLSTSVPVTVACMQASSNGQAMVTMPADVVVSSSDGRVSPLSGRGTIGATPNQAGTLELQLDLSSNLRCASQTDTLAYAMADCGTDGEVIAQLSFRHSMLKPVSDGGSLTFFVYQRQSSAGGTFDREDRLDLKP